MMEMAPIIRAFPSFTADSFLHSPYWAILTMTQTCDWSRDQSEDDQTREEGRHGDSEGVKVMTRVSPWCLVLAGELAAANWSSATAPGWPQPGATGAGHYWWLSHATDRVPLFGHRYFRRATGKNPSQSFPSVLSVQTMNKLPPHEIVRINF